jgi:hypothetical protein
MEENYQAAEERERRLQNRARRRQNWLSRRWDVSEKGNEYIRSDGYHVVVFRRRRGWGAVITDESTGEQIHSERFYATPDDVKLAAFDKITVLASRQRR